MGQRGDYDPVLLVAGGLLIGTGLFLGGYASLTDPSVSILTVVFLLAGILLSEAHFADRPLFYVLASVMLAVAVGCCLLLANPVALLTGACCIAGPMLVAKGLGRGSLGGREA